MSLYKELIDEEKKIFKVIKTLRKDYTVDDFLEAIQKIKKLKRTPQMIGEYLIRTGQERRKHQRYALDIGVELRLRDDLGKHLIGYRGYTKDVSLGGICVKLPRYKAIAYPRIKEKIRLQVRIPITDIQKYLELDGQIVWYLQKEEDYNIGIQFLSNDNKGKEVVLFQFVEDVRKNKL